MIEQLKKFDEKGKVFQLSLVYNLFLEADALNNEEEIGNTIVTRKIETLKRGTVNAISSGSWLFRFRKHLTKLAVENNLPLCSTCSCFSPMKNGHLAEREEDENLSVTGKRIKHCVVCEATGFMNAGSNNNEKRSRLMNISWGLGKESVSNDFLTHTRIDPTLDGGKKKKNGKKKTNDETIDEQVEFESVGNTIEKQNAQMLFNKAIRSSKYSFIADLDLSRVGYDDETQMYVLSAEEIKKRIKIILEAFVKTHIELTASSGLIPHLMGIEGVLMEKTSEHDRVLKMSAFEDDYLEEVEKVTSKYETFESPSEFVSIIDFYKNDDAFLDSIIQRNIENAKQLKEKNQELLATKTNTKKK